MIAPHQHSLPSWIEPFLFCYSALGVWEGVPAGFASCWVRRQERDSVERSKRALACSLADPQGPRDGKVKELVPAERMEVRHSGMSAYLNGPFCYWGLSWCSDGKESACNAEQDPCSTPGSRRSPGEGNGYPLWHFCLEKSMDWGAWWATVHGVAKSWPRLGD